MGYGSNFIVCFLCKISLLCCRALCVEPVVDFMVLQRVKTVGLGYGSVPFVTDVFITSYVTVVRLLLGSWCLCLFYFTP